MNRTLIALTLTCLSAMAARAQTEINELPVARIELPQISLLQVPFAQEPSRILPDNPIPVLPSLQDGPTPCPSGEGKSCALLGGRAYFSDPIHMTEHDATWAKAARNPAMLVGFALNLAATVADIEGTQACLRAHTCREGNPLFGSNPSRARSYGIGIPLEMVEYAAFAFVKKEGRGNLAFGLLWASTVSHVYLASGAFSYAHVVASTGTNSAKRQ
jgi:hypothetical protein